MSQLRLSWAAVCAALAFALLGCGGSDETYYIPADTELRPFSAPEAASADDAAGGEGGADEDWGSSSDEGEAGSAAPSTEAASPVESNKDDAAKGAVVKPGKPGKSEKPAAAAKGGGAGSP
jgi:hypothetical protein